MRRTAEQADDDELGNVLHAQGLKSPRLDGPQEQDLHSNMDMSPLSASHLATTLERMDGQ